MCEDLHTDVKGEYHGAGVAFGRGWIAPSLLISAYVHVRTYAQSSTYYVPPFPYESARICTEDPRSTALPFADAHYGKSRNSTDLRKLSVSRTVCHVHVVLLTLLDLVTLRVSRHYHIA